MAVRAGVSNRDRAVNCLHLITEIKDAMAHGQPWIGTFVQGRLEDVESELYWIRGPKERFENVRPGGQV